MSNGEPNTAPSSDYHESEHIHKREELKEDIKKRSKEEIDAISKYISLNVTSDLSQLPEYFRQEVLYFIKNPDPGSTFEKKIKPILAMNLSDDQLIQLLVSQNYVIDARLHQQTNAIISMIAYQVTEDLMRVFKLYTDKNYRGNRLTHDLVNILLQKQDKNVKVGE